MHFPPSVRLSPRTPYGARQLHVNLGDGPVAAESAVRYATDKQTDVMTVHEQFANEHGRNDRTDFKNTRGEYKTTRYGYVATRMVGTTRYTLTGWYQADGEYRAAVYLTQPTSPARDAFTNQFRYHPDRGDDRMRNDPIFGPVAALVHAAEPGNDAWRLLIDAACYQVQGSMTSQQRLYAVLAALTYHEIESLTTKDWTTFDGLRRVADGGPNVNSVAVAVADQFFACLTTQVRGDVLSVL